MDDSKTDYQISIPSPLIELIHACEVHCVAGCCGRDAFDIDAKHMTAWIRKRKAGIHEAKAALFQLERLIKLVKERTEDSISSDMDDFNAWWQPSQCIEYLEIWRQQLVLALAEF